MTLNELNLLLKKTEMKLYALFLCLFIFVSCKNELKSNHENTEVTSLELKYAKGFSVKKTGKYITLEITKPWPNSEKSYRHVLANYKDDFNADSTLSLPIKRIVVTSTTHIPALELLGVEHTLVAFPETDYISSKKVRTLINKGAVQELGQNENMNTEVLLSLQPDVVVGFGVDGANKTFETIEKAGIPVIYNGDWVEDSALAKAEWIKFFGILFNKEQEADSIFNTIEGNYNKAKALAKLAKTKPKVMSGAMYKDVWYLPNGSSPEGQFLKDANVDYLWQDTSGSGSLALNFEAVFEKAKDTDLWLSPSYYTSFKQLQNANNLYTKFKPFKEQHIYGFSGKTGETGGVLYYEMGTARPDLVLKDIIKICHPDVLEDYTPHFFERLK